MTEKSPFSKIDHVGVIVSDIDKVVEYYQSLGIGPFERLNLNVVEMKVWGKPAEDVKLKVQVAQMGQVQFELIQPIAGESPMMEFLQTKGEGISHLGFFVDDIDKEVAKLVEKGLKVTFSIKFLPSGGAAYLETDKIGGITLELIQFPPK